VVEIPDQVSLFIRNRIDSIEQLETLLLLRKHRDREWTPEDVSRALFTNPESAGLRLEDFHSHSLLALRAAGNKLYYRYSPKLPETDDTIAALADAYAKYPVRVIDMIFSKPLDKIRTFADAFRFRKEKH